MLWIVRGGWLDWCAMPRAGIGYNEGTTPHGFGRRRAGHVGKAAINALDKLAPIRDCLLRHAAVEPLMHLLSPIHRSPGVRA